MARPSALRVRITANTKGFVGGAGVVAAAAKAAKTQAKAKGRSVLSDLVVLGGGLVADYGIHLVSTPAAYILGGLGLVWVGTGLAPRKPRPDAR